MSAGKTEFVRSPVPFGWDKPSLMRRFSAVVTGDAHKPDWLLERTGFETSSPFISRCFHDFSADLDSPGKSHLGEKDFVVRLRGTGGVIIWWRFGFAGENIALQGFRKSPDSFEFNSFQHAAPAYARLPSQPPKIARIFRTS